MTNRKKWAFTIMRIGSVVHILNAIGLIFLPKIAKWGDVMKDIQPTQLMQFQIHNRSMVFLFNYEWAATFFGLGIIFWYLARFIKNGSRVAATISIVHGFSWICNLLLYIFMYPKDFFGITLIIIMIIEIVIWLFPLWGYKTEYVN
jgi:hypothetical protein